MYGNNKKLSSDLDPATVKKAIVLIGSIIIGVKNASENISESNINLSRLPRGFTSEDGLWYGRVIFEIEKGSWIGGYLCFEQRKFMFLTDKQKSKSKAKQELKDELF